MQDLAPVFEKHTDSLRDGAAPLKASLVSVGKQIDAVFAELRAGAIDISKAVAESRREGLIVAKQRTDAVKALEDMTTRCQQLQQEVAATAQQRDQLAARVQQLESQIVGMESHPDVIAAKRAEIERRRVALEAEAAKLGLAPLVSSN